MKPIYISAFFVFLFLQITAQDLNYYLPQNVTYNQTIPTPKSIIHHEVGEWHVTHDRLINYMYAVAKANPDRIKIERMGFSTEQREQVLLIISSPANIKNIETIRTQHLKLFKGEEVDIAQMPAVLWIGHSIHGNESSGSNAALLGAYYLAAAQGNAIDSILNQVVILYDPSFNPDGLQRFSTWANQHKSKNLVTDAKSREFNEVWPGGRFNHYWFDLNRDWLPQVHVESQNRVKWYHQWKPNILTDHHEMGSNASFFFQPGVPSRVNPLTPAINQVLTAKIADFHTAALDKLKSLYFTKENYDDFYYGKGSTYPDVQGCIGILFEQASSRGHAQQTSNGLLTFPFTIRNQFTTELSTMQAAVALRKELLQYQKDFFKSTNNEPNAYTYDLIEDPGRVKLFTEMLLRNDIKVYKSKNDMNTYVVPLGQSQHTLIKTIFEKTLDYKDSIFYDITAWTFPLAYGVAYRLKDNFELGQSVNLQNLYGNELPQMAINYQPFSKAEYGYFIGWSHYNAPAVLYELLQQGLQIKVATKPFSIKIRNEKMSFLEGTLFVPLTNQKMSEDQIYDVLKKMAIQYDVNVYSTHTGLSMSGVDLGSSSFTSINKPTIATIVGNGVNATDAGEVWHLFDQRMNMPHSHLEITSIQRTNLDKYTTIIMVGGNYNELNKDKIKAWVQNGGTLICLEEAIQWAVEAGISNVKLKKAKPAIDSTMRLAYHQQSAINGAQAMSGAIFAADIDLTHPLAYGYRNNTVSTFKGNKIFMEKSKNPFASPFMYKQNPLQSGWLSIQNKEAMNNTAAVVVNTLGNGRVINIDHNPNFRGFWLGGTKLMMNAIFFGKNIDAGSGEKVE